MSQEFSRKQEVTLKNCLRLPADHFAPYLMLAHPIARQVSAKNVQLLLLCFTWSNLFAALKKLFFRLKENTRFHFSTA